MYLFVAGPADGKRMDVAKSRQDTRPLDCVTMPERMTQEAYRDLSTPLTSTKPMVKYVRRELVSYAGGHARYTYVYQDESDDRPIIEALVEGYRNG